MNHHLIAVVGMPVGTRVASLRQLLSISVLAIVVTGCSSPVSLDVLAYDTCITRHPQEVALCEGPRQAYELEPIAFQATAAGINPAPDSSYERNSAMTQPALTPVPTRPSLIGRNR